MCRQMQRLLAVLNPCETQGKHRVAHSLMVVSVKDKTKQKKNRTPKNSNGKTTKFVYKCNGIWKKTEKDFIKPSAWKTGNVCTSTTVEAIAS